MVMFPCIIGSGGGSEGPISIDIYRDTQVVISNNSSSVTFLASNNYSGSAPSTNYPAQWYIAGSNDLNGTWTQILNQTYSTRGQDYNTQLTANARGYKYLRFGSGDSSYNYSNTSYYKNITWS